MVLLVSSHLVNKPVSPGQGATDHAGSVTDDADDPTIDSEDLAVDADSKTYDAEFPIADAGSLSDNTGWSEKSCETSNVEEKPLLGPVN